MIRLRSSEGWGGEVKAGQGLEVVEPGHDQRGLDPPALAEGQLLDQELFDGFKGADLAAIEAGNADVHHLDGARHLEADHTGLDPVEHRRGGIGMDAGHAAPPVAAWMLWTAS
jgi:hypothetical protein